MKIEIDSDYAMRHQLISYTDHAFYIKDKTLETNIIIGKDTLYEDWLPEGINQLTIKHFEPVISQQPEIVILGTGNALIFPDVEITTYFMQKNIGFEVMNIGAACRSYNLLLSENRHVIACLIRGASNQICCKP